MNLIREILENSKTIAVIGLKDDESGPAFKVPYYMQNHGYKIYPVNPKLGGKEIFGQKSYDIVTNIIDRIDVVDIFRKLNDINDEQTAAIWSALNHYDGKELCGRIKHILK